MTVKYCGFEESIGELKGCQELKKNRAPVNELVHLYDEVMKLLASELHKQTIGLCHK